MKEINIARTIMNKRKEKGLTQDELAGHIGVSKAAVSKWEIGQSYPDITILPQLASFFNISIDELMGYEPQMHKEDIRKLYVRLSHDFTVKPFEDVMEECREIAKKYFSCFPLLFQIGTLIVNNSMESGNRDRSMTAIKEAKELFIRVKSDSEDAELCTDTIQKMFALFPVKKGADVKVISAAFHAIYYATLHKKEIGEEGYDQALRMLIHGVVTQII